jgi:hypothetical protein
MPTPLLSNESFDLFNDTYNNAVKARQMGVYLDTQPNDQEAAKQWHLIADSLFEAVALYDKMATESNKPLWARPKQKTM